MYTEIWLELSGEVANPPEFKEDKNGRLYCMFYMYGTMIDKKVRKFRCFAWDSEVLRYIQSLKIVSGDNVSVKGIFNIAETEKHVNKRNGETVIKESFDFRVYVKHFSVISTKSLMEKLRQTALKQKEITNVEQKEVTENLPKQIKITDKDDTF